MSRKLATVRRIGRIEPIEGADRIELVHINGWQCVTQKGNFKEGDLCVYFEIDSRLPEAEWSSFLAPRKYKIKTIKLKGVLSQGLVLPLDVCLSTSSETYGEGQDVTKELGVTKILTKDEERELRDAEEGKRKSAKMKWYRTFPIIRSVCSLLFPNRSRSFPSFIPKTDETRVQNIRDISRHVHGKLLYATEKLDGQSVTIFYHKGIRTSLWRRGLFGVCSRNIYYPTPVRNNWWDITIHEGLDKKLTEYCKRHNRSLAIQGEIVGEGIQGNKYKRIGRTLFVFSVWDIDKQRYLSKPEKDLVLLDLHISQVPLMKSIWLEGIETTEEFLLLAEGESVLNDVEREGIVIRDIFDDSFSFKAISNKWLLEYKE